MLTTEQAQAVCRRSGPLMLSAGAGSGKTSVLVERFVGAVCEDGVAPSAILAITFTERAAGELRERIRARLVELRERDAAREAEEAFVTTFHGFCARLLRAHPLHAGVDPRFSVLDEGIASRLASFAFADALRDVQAEHGQAAVELVAAYGADALQGMVLGAYQQLRSQGQTEPRLPGSGEEPACELIDALLRHFASAYHERKRARAALDFDDLELLARDLLREQPTIRAAWSERFALTMVDEFQDTNPRQLELIELIERENLFTVGDELQSIYGFRHADVRLFRQRRERLAGVGAALALTHNFRGRPTILTAVDRVFSERLGARYTPLVASRETDTARESEAAVELLLTDCTGPWREAEAGLLAARIRELVHEEHVPARDVVVLLRSLTDVPLYERALRASGLRTLATTGDFWSHSQVRDLLAYLKALCNPLDELALYGTLASALVGLSSDALALVASAARERACSAWEAIVRMDSRQLRALLPPPDSERLRRFRDWLVDERANAAFAPLADLLRRAMNASGYEAYVLSLPEGPRRVANIRKLIAAARSFELREGRDLRAFLDHVAHLQQARAGREPEAPVLDAHVDAVRLMSIHSAKGLEFAVVCVADLARKPTLTVPDLIVERDGRLGLRLAQLGEPELSPVLDYAELREESRAAQQEEEDRVLYVAMTRARERLVLSGAVDFARWPSWKPGAAPICWLAPALVPDIRALAEAPGPEPFDVEVGAGLRVRCVLHRPSGDSCDRPVAPAHADESVPVAPAYAGDWAAAVGIRAGNRAAIVGMRAGGLTSVAAEAVAAGQTPELGLLADPGGTLSYSSLAELERCGYRYYLERVLHMSERRDGRAPGSEGMQARMRGTVVHMLLEDVDFQRPAAVTEQDVARVARRLTARISPAERERIAALLNGALQSEMAARIGRARDLRREHPFAFSLGRQQPLLVGVLDLLAQESDGSQLIVDYKSDRTHAGHDLELVVEGEYGLQRLLYALAVIEAGAEQVSLVHWFLECPHEPVQASFAAADRELLREQLAERLGALRNRGFAVCEVPHRGICATCPGRGTLCSWGETRTLREPSATLESVPAVATLSL